MNTNIENRLIPKEGEVDMVYIWCDANDPAYIKNRKKYSEKYNLNTFWSPTRDHGEIRYSILSVRKHIPWVRDIIICSPKWHRVPNLDTEKYSIRYVDNEEILGEENCPNFNSHSLELYTYKIPWLSDYFIQCNDDFFITQKIWLEEFYNKNNSWINYYYEPHLYLWTPLSQSTWELIFDLTWDKYYFWPTHIPRLFFKKDINNIIDRYTQLCDSTKKNYFRSNQDFQMIHFYGYYLLSQNKWNFIFLKNILPQSNIVFAMKIVFQKLLREWLFSTLHQIYLQVFYKKKLFKNKIFSNKEIYSLIQIWNNLEKNKKNIDYALERWVKFICLNDGYNSKDTKLHKKIMRENYEYFYKKLELEWKK